MVVSGGNVSVCGDQLDARASLSLEELGVLLQEILLGM